MKIVATVCMFILGAIYLYNEFLLVYHNFWMLFNPVTYFYATWYFITTPLTWLVSAILLGTFLVESRKEKEKG